MIDERSDVFVWVKLGEMIFELGGEVVGWSGYDLRRVFVVWSEGVFYVVVKSLFCVLE